MILVFGKTGQVGRELALAAPDAAYLSRAEADLADPEACAAAIRAARPEAVINAAAYTAVDQAEGEQRLANSVNGASPGAMARACADLRIPFVHISTEYVFDGQGETPFAVDGPLGPVNVYGRSKLAGEEEVRAAGGRYIILRTSWVFSVHGSNFVKTMMRLGDEHATVKVVEDQIGGPTPARAIADACLRSVRALQADPGMTGTYHFCGLPHVSRAEFAREIFALMGQDTVVEGVTTDAFPTPAVRPPNSRLDCTSLAALGLTPPDWRLSLAEVIAELEAE